MSRTGAWCVVRRIGVEFYENSPTPERSDIEGWTGLAELASRAARDDLVLQFLEAALTEEDHRFLVQAWLQAQGCE